MRHDSIDTGFIPYSQNSMLIFEDKVNNMINLKEYKNKRFCYLILTFFLVSEKRYVSRLRSGSRPSRIQESKIWAAFHCISWQSAC